jgi:acetyl-CoA carboxylase biotin carboxylase subunit
MIRKVLIACHGEVAARLVGHFQKSGVRTVVTYTEQDCLSEHVRLADEAICIAETLQSYDTDWQRIISAAEVSEVQAIHVGNGPLSYHERFAETCAQIGVQLLGRNAEQGGFT